MCTQTLIPAGRSLTLEVPEALADQPFEVLPIPVRLAEDRDTRRLQLRAFFDQYQADARKLGYDRDELYGR